MRILDINLQIQANSKAHKIHPNINNFNMLD